MFDKPLPSTTSNKAPHPFDDSDPSADIILRTPELIEFYVHSPILSYASPIFSGMLSLPQPENGSRAQRPVIDVSEDSRALDRLLRFCYPILKPNLPELEDIVPVLMAALKYEMEWPVFLLSKELRAMIPSNPLKIWAVACRAGLEQVTREAAFKIRGRVKAAREARWSPAPRGYALGVLAQLLAEDTSFSCLRDVSAGDYYRLRERLDLSEPPDASFRFLSHDISSPVEEQPCPGDRVPPQHSVSRFPEGFVPHIPFADVLLQSRDQESVYHSAHGAILALHSIVLGQQFAQAKADRATGSQADTDSKGTSSICAELPLLQLDVSSDTLASLLAVCYEGSSSLPSSCGPLAAMLVASRDLHMSQVHSIVSTQWDVVSESSPLEAFFVAIHHGLKDHARGAARKVVERPLSGRYVPHMEDASALTYHRLSSYYDACVDAVREELKKVIAEWEKRLTPGVPTIYSINIQNDGVWMRDYLRRLERELDSGGPGRLEVTVCNLLDKTGVAMDFWPISVNHRCQSLAKGIFRIGSTLPDAIADAIAKVR